MSATGKWKVVLSTPMGNQELVFDLKEEGGELTGTISGPNGVSELFNGSATGNSLKWSGKATKPIPMDLEFSAEIDGSAIKGGAKSLFGVAPFEGVRA